MCKFGVSILLLFLRFINWILGLFRPCGICFISILQHFYGKLDNISQEEHLPHINTKEFWRQFLTSSSQGSILRRFLSFSAPILSLAPSRNNLTISSLGILNCFKNILICKLLFPSNRFIYNTYKSLSITCLPCSQMHLKFDIHMWKILATLHHFTNTEYLAFEVSCHTEVNFSQV